MIRDDDDDDDDEDNDELKKFQAVRIADEQAGGCHFPSFANQRPRCCYSTSSSS